MEVLSVLWSTCCKAKWWTWVYWQINGSVTYITYKVKR